MTENRVRWGTAEVLAAEDVAYGVRRIVLAPSQPVHARPGTHIDLRLDDVGRTLTRSYSIVRSEDGGRRLTLTVQLSEASRGGSKRMHTLEPGERLAVTAPLQNFPLGVGAARYVLLAGGIGITALIAMASALRQRGADYEFVVVGRTRELLPYLDELTAEHGERLRVHIDAVGGRIDIAQLIGAIADHPDAQHTDLYMCGPIGLMDAVRREWSRRTLPPTSLRFETFGNSGSWAAEEFTIDIPALDRIVRVPAHATMLEALEGAGIDVMSDCRKGECGLCTVKVLDLQGRLDHRDVFFDDTQKSTDEALCACVSRAAVPDHSVRTAAISIELA